MKRTPTLAVAAAALVVATTVGSSSAAPRRTLDPTDNRMTFPEWYNVAEGQTQGDVQDNDGGCDCTGTVTRRWLGDDNHARKWVLYPDTDTNSSLIEYRLTADGVWHTDLQKFWATDGVGLAFPY